MTVSSLSAILAIAAILYGSVAGALYFFQRNLMYHPDQGVPTPQSYGVPEMRAERILNSDGHPLLAWWKAPADAGKPVIIYYHGNAGDLGDRADKVTPYLQAGLGVLLISYRYNAGAGGQPSEDGLLDDARAARGFVLEQGIAEERIIYYGESLGSGLAVRMAVDHPARAVVLEAPYTSIADVARARYWFVPVNLLLKDRYDSAAIIGRVRAPVLIVHGRRDGVIASSYGEALYSAAPNPKRLHLIDEAHHTNLYDFGMGALVLDFLDTVPNDRGADTDSGS